MIIRWMPLAEQDLDFAYDYIRQDSPGAAKRIVSRIISAVGILTRHPLAGREGRVGGTREMVVGRTPFIVAYRLRGDEIQILAVIHSAKRWPTGFTAN